MRRTCLRILSSSLLVVTSVAQAATLGDATGTVQANFGQGFVPVTIAQNLPIGTVVTVQPGGQAKVAFDDLCVQVIQPGQVFTVQGASPCAQGAPTVTVGPLPIDYAIVAVGTAAAVGTGVLIYQLSRSASP